MTKQKLVMVGNGMAGVRALEELLKLAPDLHDITVFGGGPPPNYNRIMLSPVLAGEQTIDEIILNPVSWYEEHGIRLRMGRKVTRIDRARRVVIADDGSEEPYDRLLLATGSNPFILPVPGKDLEGVIAYRDIADTRAMIETAATHRHAAVAAGADRRPAGRGRRSPPRRALQGRAGSARRPGGHGRGYPPQHRAGPQRRHPLRPRRARRHQRHRYDADRHRPARLRRGRMRFAPGRGLRPGGTAVRTGQGGGQPPGAHGHRA